MAAGVLVSQIAGGALSGAGQVKANRDEAEVLRRNVDRFEEMSEIAGLNQVRRERLFRQELDDFEARQIGAFAKAGVDLSGSALNKLNRTATRAADELTAIRRQSELEARASRDSANEALSRANRLESVESFGLTFGGSVLGGASRGLQGIGGNR